MSTNLIPRRASRALSSILGTDPFRSLQKEMDELLDRFSLRWNGEGRGLEGISIPAMDVSETDGEVQLTVDVPGMKADEINVEVSGRTVQIRGEHKEEKEEKGRTYQKKKPKTPPPHPPPPPPPPPPEDKVAAEYKDGVLTVKLPKSEEAKSHKVTVKAVAK